MMITATIFTIIKVAGLAFLSLLALIVLLLILVLTVPVRYGIRGTYDKKPAGRAVVSWLFHLLSCKVSYDKELTVLVRILGFPITVAGGKKKELESRDGADGEGKMPLPKGASGSVGNAQPQTAAKPGEMMSPPEAVSGEGDSQFTGTAGTEEELSGEEAPFEEGLSSQGEASYGEEASSEEEKSSGKKADRKTKSARGRKKRQKQKEKKKPGFSFAGLCDKLKGKADSIRGKIRNIKMQIQELLEKKDQVVAFLKDKGNQAAFLLVKKKLIAVLKHSFPKKYRGRFRFGFEDPYKTGQILTCAAPFYGIYGGKLELIPVFEEEVLEGELEVSGRVCLGYLVLVGIQILLDRNFRILLKKLKRMRG